MKIFYQKQKKRGYSIMLAVVSVGLLIMLLLLMSYRQTIRAVDSQAKLQMRIDYTQKENALLRSLVTILPEYAAKVMSSDSRSKSGELTWEKVFQKAADYSNAISTHEDADVKSLIPADAILANTGVVSFTNVKAMIHGVESGSTSIVTPGLKAMDSKYPDPLEANLGSSGSPNDNTYPLINSARKTRSGQNFDLLKYPKITFGLVKQGENFIAKRNWWAFQVDYIATDKDDLEIQRVSKKYVISLYEVPTQTPISAASVAILGSYGNGEKWGTNISVEGAVVGEAIYAEENVDVNSLAARSSVAVNQGAKIGDFTAGAKDVNASGVRESYIASRQGNSFLPVASAGDSGRVAFIPINPGASFFQLDFEKLSDTRYPNYINQISGAESWEKYSRVANQCPMKVLIRRVRPGATSPIPDCIEINYVKGGYPVREFYAGIDQSPIDGVTPKKWDSEVKFPFRINDVGVTEHMSKQRGLEIRVDKIPDWLESKGANTKDNYAMVVNAVPRRASDGVVAIPNQLHAWLPPQGEDPLKTNEMIRIVLNDCDDLEDFDKGFAIVTDMMVHIMDNLNTESKIPFALYAPAVRYRDHADVRVQYEGQMSSIDMDPTKIQRDFAQMGTKRPVGFHYGDLAVMDTPGNGQMSQEVDREVQHIHADRIQATLKQIRRVDDLPPVTMKNWLVILEQVSD